MIAQVVKNTKTAVDLPPKVGTFELHVYGKHVSYIFALFLSQHSSNDYCVATVNFWIPFFLKSSG